MPNFLYKYPKANPIPPLNKKHRSTINGVSVVIAIVLGRCPAANNKAIYISPVPTIRTVKGRVVFFRAQHEKISTLNPLTVRIFAAAFSPPKTGNRISKPCPRFRPLHFSGKTVCTCAAFTVGFCGASRPAPPTSNKEQKQPLQRRKACEYGVFTPAAASFPRWAGVLYSLPPKRILAVHWAHFQPFSLPASP